MHASVDTTALAAQQKVISKYALPNAHELHQLHAADPTNTYHSSFFRLQVDQLLEAVQVKESSKFTHGMQNLLFTLKNALESIEEQQVTQEALQLASFYVRNHIKRKEIVLPFQKPSRIDILGSFILKNMAFIKQNSSNSEYGTYTVDVAVEMPSDCFLQKDFANYRYFDKRNLYLGVLASEMKNQSVLFSKVTVSGFVGEYEKPIVNLHVNPTYLNDIQVKSIKKICIRLIPVLPQEVFKLVKLAPLKNNIRHDPNISEEEILASSTPHYNNSILEDIMMRRHTKELHAAIADSPQLAEACILAKVWLRQRGFHKCVDSLNSFLISMVLLYLFTKKRINAQTPSDQMFKVLLQFLATHKFADEPIIFPPSETDGVALTSEGMSTFQSAFDVVFLDSSGRFNLFGRVHRSAIQEVQDAAKESMNLIQQCTMEDFRMLFIKKNEFWMRYDQFFWFPCPFLVDEADEETYTNDEKKQINDMGLEIFWMRKITSLVSRALMNRVTLVRPFLSNDDATKEWNMNATSLPSKRRVALGLRINPEHAFRIVDKGPSAENKAEALAFRQFWKTKSDLRRFRDGAIVEAIVWDEVPSNQKYRLLETIVKHITTVHCPQLTSDVIHTSNASLYSMLDVQESLKKQKKIFKQGSTTMEKDLSLTTKLWQVFNGLAKILRDMDSLPLKVSDILPIHSSFRHTSLFPIQEHPLAFSQGEKNTCPIDMLQINTVLEPILLHLKFEKSSSWPNEEKALRHAKTGFYVHLAHEFETKGIRCEPARDCLDVFLSGFVFRIVIQSEKEMSILTKNGQKKLQLVNTSAYIALKQETQYATQHAKMLHALHSKNISFGPTVRLAQRWLADKFMSNTLKLEAIELLVAHGFLHSTTDMEPHSILSGFLRFLKLVANFEFFQQPLVVDLNHEMDDTNRREIMKRFEASSASPTTHPAMFIAANYEDIDCLSAWTRLTPERVVVTRLAKLARVSYDLLINWLSKGAFSTAWLPAFQSSKSEFDAMIVLDLDRLPSKRMKLQEKNDFSSSLYKNMDLTSISVMIGFDPVVEYLKELTKRFGHVALFFINNMEPKEILITWKPQAFLPTKFRAITSNGLITLSKELVRRKEEEEEEEEDIRTYAIPNIFEILSEMQKDGQGMVESIQISPFEDI